MKKLGSILLSQKYIGVIGTILLLVLSLISAHIYNSYKKNEVAELEKILKNIYLNKTVNSIFESFEPRYKKITYTVNEGDTIEKIFNKIEIDTKEKKLVLRELKTNKISNIYKNQKFEFMLDRLENVKVLSLKISLTKKKDFLLLRAKRDDIFSSREIEKNLKKKLDYKESLIKSSLYSSAITQKIPPNIIIEFARIYGFEIDFQRDIWKNDSYQIIYEKFINEKKQVVETGNIIFANMILRGKEYPLYMFETDGKIEFFDIRGRSVKKTLMKTPINGARLSSSFGKRKHPILGFTKMHTGTDFAAPTGTPIMASGDGTVLKASWCGGGGNCIKIKHNSTYTTVYAHMSKFAKGIKKGKKVVQGQVIGYVGSTGMSTGPHLHYEVIENNKKINSQTLKLPSGKTLKGSDRKKFEIKKINTNVLKAELIDLSG